MSWEDEHARETAAFLAKWERDAAEFTAKVVAEIETDVERAKLQAFEENAEPPEPPRPPIVSRHDYVPKELEGKYLVRDDEGLPVLRLVDAGDRLAVWSPTDGGALINPKGPGLRRLGLCSSYARGAKFMVAAFRSADLRKGRWVELRREPANQHDANAVALHSPGAGQPFGYVQRGRAPSIARRIDGGEDMAGVSMRGPAPGRADDSVLLILGSRRDLEHMVN